MNRLFVYLITILFLSLTPLTVSAKTLAISGATILDGNGGPPIRDGVIVIKQGRIIAIGDQQTPIPDTAEVYSAKGKTIIPGLMDANVHLLLAMSSEFLLRYEDRLEPIIEEAAQLRLRYGVTTVFDSWGPLGPLKNVRQRIRDNKIPGPNLFIAGNIIGLDGPLSQDFYSNTETLSAAFLQRINAMWEQGTGRELLFMTPQQVRERIRSYIAKEVDFLKFAVSGHGDHNMGFLLFSPEVQQIIIEEGHRAEMIVQSHTTSVESVRLATAAQVDIMQHCALTLSEIIPQSSIENIVDRGIPCTFNAASSRFLKKMFGELRLDYRAIEDSFEQIMTVSHINQTNLVKAGATTLLATDGAVYPYPDDPAANAFIDSLYPNAVEDMTYFTPKGHFIWLEAMADKGLQPMQLLQAATINIAKAYKVDKDLGSLEPGKIADLVILDKSPLDNVNHYRQIHKVMKRGQWVDRDSLPLKRVFSR